MIIHSFDTQTDPIMTVADFYGAQGQFADTCLVTFSHEIHSHLLRTYPCEQIARIRACNGFTPVYAMELAGKTLAFYLSGVGATAAATNVIEANWLTGAEKFIMFGSAGSLNRAATGGSYVIPTEAYRDEGISYHYAPAADFIRIPGADRLAALFHELSVPYVQGRVWTTDAFYRETRGQVARRQAEGCIAVEMELAGVQAVCDYHGFTLYDFLVTGDVLDSPAYDRTGLHGANHDLDKLHLALEIARRL